MTKAVEVLASVQRMGPATTADASIVSLPAPAVDEQLVGGILMGDDDAGGGHSSAASTPANAAPAP
jgi:hypothetical protein